jgi:hypothetical protein
MPISDYHIQQNARDYIELHGDNAAAKAQERVAYLSARGDTLGAEMWTRIVATIEELQKQHNDASG